MVLQRKLRPSIPRVNVQLDPRHAASKHTTASINHTRPSPRKHSPDGAARARKHIRLQLTTQFIDLERMKGWVDLGGWLHTEIKCRLRESNPDTVTHPSTNRARRRVTSLIRATMLPLHHAAVCLSVFVFVCVCASVFHVNWGYRYNYTPKRVLRQLGRNYSDNEPAGAKLCTYWDSWDLNGACTETVGQKLQV